MMECSLKWLYLAAEDEGRDEDGRKGAGWDRFLWVLETQEQARCPLLYFITDIILQSR